MIDRVGLGRLAALHVGTPTTVRSREGEWESAIWKRRSASPRWLSLTNLDGDAQADLVNHGGPDKAVCVYPSGHYAYWREEGARELDYGAFGENMTVDDVGEADVCIGDVYELGDVVVQISQPRQPCWKLARRFGVPDLAAQVQRSGRTGWYLRVLREGLVAEGLEFLLVDRPHPEWAVTAANRVMHGRPIDATASGALADCTALSGRWQATLRKRQQRGEAELADARLFGR